MAVKFSQFTTGATLADIDYFVGYQGTNNVQIPKALLTGIDGSGTANYIPKFIDSDTLGDSNIYEDASGNVGIGTTSPTDKLQISAGNIQLDDYYYVKWGNTYISGINNAFMRLFTNGSERMRIDSSGNVGIGTASPSVSLDVSSTDAIKVPDGTTAERPGSPAAGMFRYNSDTAAFEGYTTAWGAIGGGGVTITKDQFTGDNTTVAFTLSVTPSSADNINIYISGVYQNSLDSAGVANYSVAGTTLTFVTAPPVTATNGIEVVITE